MKRTVQHILTRPGGSPIAGRTFSLQLIGPGFTDNGHRQIIFRSSPATDDTGLLSFEVESNDAIDPAGTYYTLRIDQGEIYAFVVPSGGTDVLWLRDLLVEAPEAPSGLTVGIPVQPTPPDPSALVWFDTSTVPPILKYWDGDSWEPLPGSGGGTVSPFPSLTTFPSSTLYPKAA